MYLDALTEGTVADLLNVEPAEAGDVFFTPAGRVHAIGKGTVLVEIQQTSDITYRIFDWNRVNTGDEVRELHTDLALDAIDFSASGHNKIKIIPELNTSENLVKCEFFNTNILRFDRPFKREYYLYDSFVIFICVEGELKIKWDESHEILSKGETVLLPAMIKEVILEPSEETRLLEVYIDTDEFI